MILGVIFIDVLSYETQDAQEIWRKLNQHQQVSVYNLNLSG